MQFLIHNPGPCLIIIMSSYFLCPIIFTPKTPQNDLLVDSNNQTIKWSHFHWQFRKVTWFKTFLWTSLNWSHRRWSPNQVIKSVCVSARVITISIISTSIYSYTFIIFTYIIEHWQFIKLTNEVKVQDNFMIYNLYQRNVQLCTGAYCKVHVYTNVVTTLTFDNHYITTRYSPNILKEKVLE